MEKIDLLIIGGGPAAVTIAKTIKNKMKVAIIRPEDHAMIYCAMPYAIEKLLPLEKTLKADSVVTDEGAELIRDKVVSVNFNIKEVITEKKKIINYKKLVIATGASPILPPIEGHDLNNVMTFKTEENLKEIMDKVDKGLKKAVIIGAGAIGIELAQALNERNVETHLVDMAKHVLPNMTDTEMINQAQASLIETGINLHLESKVEALKGNENVTEVLLGDNKEIDLSSSDNKVTSGLVVFAVGMKPNVQMFNDTDLEIERDGIVINNKMETNIKDVYAVGDCCQFTSAITGKVLSGKLATNAVPMGKVLAQNLIGKERTYSGFYNGAATKINDYYIGGTGFSEASAKKFFNVVTGYANLTTAFPVMPNATKVKLKLIVDTKTHKVVGGQFVSGRPVADKVDKITMAIQYGITIEQLADFSYSSQPYQSFFPSNNLIIKAADEIINKLETKEEELIKEKLITICKN